MVKLLLLSVLSIVFCGICVAEDPVAEEVTPFVWPEVISIAIEDMHYDREGTYLYTKHDIRFMAVSEWVKIRPLTMWDVIEYGKTGHITLTRVFTDGVI